MCRLREQIEPTHALEHILRLLPALLHLLRTLPHQGPNVPRLCMDITAHVHDPLAPELEYLVQEVHIAALPRRVDDERRLLWRKVRNGRKDMRGVARAEGDAICGEAVECGVLGRGGDRFGREFDACDGDEIWGEHNRKETGSAVRIDKMSGRVRNIDASCLRGFACRKDGFANVFNQREKDRVVVLEERASVVLEKLVSYFLAHNTTVVCDTYLV